MFSVPLSADVPGGGFGFCETNMIFFAGAWFQAIRPTGVMPPPGTVEYFKFF
jgi:hypothetical protein